MSRGNPRVAFRVRSELKADLDARAAELAMEPSDVARLALEKFLAGPEEPSPSPERPLPVPAEQVDGSSDPSDDQLAMLLSGRARIAVFRAKREVAAGNVKLAGGVLEWNGERWVL